MVHDYIRDSRDDKIESSKASIHISKIKEYLPPCSRDISAFSPHPSKIIHHDPLDWRNLPEVEEDLPQFSFCTAPYGRMFSEEKGVTWESDPEEQRRRLREYFGCLKKKSLVFFYTNHGNPIIEDTGERLLIGVARIKEIGDQLYFQKTPKFPDDYPLWSRRITIDPKQSVRLPYQEYLQMGLDPSNIVCRVPDSVTAQFSYVSEHLTDDQAAIVLERLIQSVKTVQKENKIPSGWNSRIRWLDGVLAEVWQNRGAYPGIGSVLNHLSFQNGIIYQNEVLRKLSDKGKNVLKHVISILVGKRKPEKEFQKDFEVARAQWRDLPKARKDLLSTLCLFELTKKQVDRGTNSILRKGAGIIATDADIIKNPYILCEQDQGGKDSSPIQFEQIDHGMIPLPDVAKAWGDRSPLPPNDKRRVRALLVTVLSAAAQEGDTLLLLEEALSRVQSWLPEERACQPDSELIRENSDFYLQALNFDLEADYPFVALLRFRNMEIKVAECIEELAALKPFSHSGVDWKKELLREFGEAGRTHLDIDVENRAQQEKATALEKLFTHRFSILTGRAGTGKTTVAKILLKSIPKEQDALLLAPTGKARIRLQETAQLPAKTIHQFLWENGWIARDTLVLKETGGRIIGKSTVIVDEASMIPLDLLATLFRAIDFNEVKRLILIGDPSQLPPIGPGRPFVDILNWLNESEEKRNYIAYLCERARQKNRDSEVLKLSDCYTSENPTPNDDEILSDIALGYNKRDLEVHIWKDTPELVKILDERMNALLGLGSSDDPYAAFNKSLGVEEPEDGSAERWQILSPVRMQPYGIRDINRIIQKKYRAGLIERARHGWRHVRPFGDEQLVWTDKVIQVVNKARRAWSAGPIDGYVANGEVGIITNTKKEKNRKNDSLDVRFSTQPDVTYRYWRNEVDENLELAYAITVHKSQGSDFDIVFLIVPQNARNLCRELLYTGLTRSREKLVLLVEKDIGPLRKFRKPIYSVTQLRNTNIFYPIFRAEGVEVPYAEKLIHRTLTGEMVRSKSEVIVANILTRLRISYKYEEPLEFGPNDFRLPDFTIQYKGQTHYWEHLGMINIPSYKRDWERRKRWYERHGLLDKIITSQDGPDGSIDSKEIEQIAKERVLQKS
jgi:hypothetical protein